MKFHVIACEVFKDEFFACERPGATFTFLPQGYHRIPTKMPPAIQQEIARVSSPEVEAILLGYGLCSNGVVGLEALHSPLVIPRVHDCIALLLGSLKRYIDEVSQYPGTFYLTRGWIEYGRNPYSEYLHEYIPKYGEETAEWVAREMMKHYQRVVLISHGLGPMEKYQHFAQEMATFFRLSYQEIEGSLDYIKKFLSGQWDEDFILVQKGEKLSQEVFMCTRGLCLY